MYSLYLSKDKEEIIFKKEKIILKSSEDISFNKLGDFLVKNNIIKTSETFNQLVKYKNYDN